MTDTYVLATANPDKAKEIQAILGNSVNLLPRPIEIPDVDETGSTLVDNARLKARALTEATGLPAISDDSGLEVDALDGAPGVYSARYAGEDATYADNINKLLEALRSHPLPHERRARFVTVAMVTWPDGRELWAEGEVLGKINASPAGEAGFGYDPVFAPDGGGGRTFAEMTADEKHALSHRGRAFRALADRLAGGSVPPGVSDSRNQGR